MTEVWAGGASSDYGYRRSRKHPSEVLAADWGPEKFRQVRRRAQAGFAGRLRERSPNHRDHVGIEGSATAESALVPPPTQVARRARRWQRLRLAKREGIDGGRTRFTAQQGLVVLDVEPSHADSVAEELTALGLTVRPSNFHRGTIACTGIEFCKLALVETKGRAEVIRTELENRMPDFDTPITINVNGCPNSCARFQIADIGFKGIVQKAADGDVEAFQDISAASWAEAGRKFRGLKVTAGRSS